MTGRDVVTAALRLLGAIAPGESLDAAEASDGLGSLNRMISSWSTESLIVYARTRQALTLTANDGQYTIGPSADFNTTRPIRIDQAAIRNESVSPAQESPLQIMTLAEWQAITAKDSTADIPTAIYPDGGFPTQTLRLYPVPTTAHKLVLWTQEALSSISTLDTSVSLPPGYEEALVYNLAMRLAPEYGKPVPDAVAVMAAESKGNIKRANLRPIYLKVESFPSGNLSGFDITRGSA